MTHRKIARGWIGVALAATVLAPSWTFAVDPNCRRQIVPPQSRYYNHNGFLYLGYGVDPIPSATVSQRWYAWKAARNRTRMGQPSYYQPQPQSQSPAGASQDTGTWQTSSPREF